MNPTLKTIIRKLFALGALGVMAASLRAQGAEAGQSASAVMLPAQGTFWAGEIFPLTFQVTVPRALFQSLSGGLTWSSSVVDAEDWSAPQIGEGASGGVPAVVHTWRTRGYARTPGEVAINAGTQSVNVRSQKADASGFGGDMVAQIALTSPQPKLTIKELPAPKPEGFSKAVGAFTLTSTLNQTKIAVGETLTWTLELSGLGNWPEIRGLPARRIPKDFEVIAPAPRRVAKNGQAFEGSLIEEVSLVARRPGEFRLGPVKFSFFNPKEGRYETLTTEVYRVQVIGTADPTLAAELDAAPAGVAVPSVPPPLPLDPVASGARGGVPWSQAVLAVAAAVPFGGLLVWWLALARRRSGLTDPQRARRDAFGLVADLTARIAGGVSSSELPHVLFAWQRALAVVLDLPAGTATAAQLEAVIAAREGSVAERWIPLWREADRVIYAAGAVLPTDWATRAEAALRVSRLRPQPWLTALQPRNLFPIAALVLLLVTDVSALRAEPGIDAYRAGRFEAAESIWRRTVSENNLETWAHHNLSLALAQQDRWSEAAAEALAAVSQEPDNGAYRWQLRLSLDRSGIDQPLVRAFARGEGFFALAGRYSAHGWGILLVTTSAGFCLAAAWWLALLFASRPRGLTIGVGLLVIGAGAMVGVSAGSVRHYALLGEADVAIVGRSTVLRSVPTEAETEQKTVPLPAGSLGRATGTFLGWTQLTFPNGQTGWVRSDALTRLY